eukprot:SAG31_NODE_4557_length_3142_cov_1.739073_2_plen_297_part_00
MIHYDADRRRAALLTGQLKRFSCPGLLVTCCDARNFPDLGGSGLFDRVLCDVPCSGDGTLRKAAGLWARWDPEQGLGRHPLQLSILQRGLELLKPGGRLVYSTCSLSPYENEAVVAAALLRRNKKGKLVPRKHLQIVDVSDELPNMRRDPGLLKWQVHAPGGGYYTDFSAVPVERHVKWPSTVFPPRRKIGRKIGLTKVLRLLPHYHNSGGFFVCVIKRETNPTAGEKALKKRKRGADEIVAERNDEKATKTARGPRKIQSKSLQEYLQCASAIDDNPLPSLVISAGCAPPKSLNR